MKKLLDQAWELHAQLQRAAYRHSIKYAFGYSYNKAAETDPVLARYNTILGRSQARIARRAGVRNV